MRDFCSSKPEAAAMGRHAAKPHTVPVRDWRTGLGAGTEAGLGTEFLAVTRTEVDWGLSPRPQAGTED